MAVMEALLAQGAPGQAVHLPGCGVLRCNQGRRSVALQQHELNSW